MNLKKFKTAYIAAFVLGVAGLATSPVQADPPPAASTVPNSKLVATYSDFAGSPENSASIVHGLRTGSPITLTDPVVAGGPPPVSTTFTPPTKPMGYGNVRIALSLAEAQLASQGISNPTATELQGALIGSTTIGPGGTTTTEGVLQMRASGMGWGQIANSMGYKLGPIISGKQTVVATTTTGSAVATAAGANAAGIAGTKGKGVVTGTGVVSGGAKNVTTGTGGATHGQSSGITTGLGHASSNAGGVVTAAGNKAGSNTGGNAGSNGKGGGKP